jgi:signal transduction histidine kinase
LSRYVTTEQQEKREKHIKRIKSAVVNLNGILNDFLSLSKLEEGKVDVTPSHFFWNIFCQEVYEELEGLLKDNQTMQHQLLPEDQIVYLDERILKNIFYNLISNAIKYSEKGTTIYCRSKVENEKLHFEIQDEGMGIPAIEQQYLFTRFFRAANVINIQGTGLGLTIVKSYIDLLGGKIHFESIERIGTTFFIELPLVYENTLPS